MKERNALREAELFVCLQRYPTEAAELDRRGYAIEAMEKVALVETVAAELKGLLAERAGVNE